MKGLRGFVDLQVNGFRGVDFSDPGLSEDALVSALRGLVADGTAILLPTMITAPEEVYARNLPLLARVAARPEFAPHVPGFHLEGPFLCRREGAAGAHNPDWMKADDPAFVERLQGWADGRIRLLTVAPDIAGADAVIGRARQLGITVALGHHLASAEESDKAVRAGASCVTHLGNGLPHLVDRHRNPLIDGLADDRLTVCVIGDGHHLPWSLVKVILRAKGLNACCLVSDASSLAGMPAGSYPCFGATAVIASDGRLYNPATGYLMGSSFTIRRVANAVRCNLGIDDAAIRLLTVVNPLRMIGLSLDALPGELPRDSTGGWLPLP